MATTTAVNSYRSAGIPDDAVGSVGDVCTDTSNRTVWVKQANNSWVGGQLSLQGPVGPAQLSYAGKPPDTFGQDGNGATDQITGTTYIKSGGTWGSPVGTIIGPTGPSNLGSTGSSFGQAPQTVGASITSTPQTMLNGPGTTASIYQPIFASSFLGCSVISTCGSGTTTFTLYDQTASSAVYSITCAANNYALSGSAPFSVAAYQLIVGHQYVWQISNTASQTGGGYVFPIYATPSASAAPAVSLFPLMGFASSTTIGTSYINVPFYGGTQQYVYIPIRTAGCYAVQATLTATGSTASTATATFTGTYTQLSNNATGTLGWSQGLTANGVPTLINGPSTDTTTFNPAFKFTFAIKSSASITATLAVQILGYI